MPLPTIKADKWKHVIVGALLGAAGLWLLLRLFTGNKWTMAAVDLLGVAVIAYGFELFSKFTGKGHYEMADAIASVIGGLIGIAIVFPLL